MKKYKVLDTNILLLDAKNLQILGKDGSIIILPETTLDEIDVKKTGFGELAYQARETARMIKGAEKTGVIKHANMVINTKKLDDTILWVVSSTNYPDFRNEDPKIINDRKIIDIASQIKKVNIGEVIFITNDIMCENRAEAVGLYVEDVKDIDNVTFNFTKELSVPHEVFTSIHGRDITTIDYDYTKENYNYKFTSHDTSQMKLATIKNNTINVLGKDSETELRKQNVNPANADQLFMSRAIQDQTIDFVVCDALAGSGKTLVALSNAIRLIGVNSPYESITYIRASVNDVEPEEEVGFLKGDADDKNAMYLLPLSDSLDFMIRSKYTKGKIKGVELEEKVAEGVEKLKSRCNITGMTGLGMRGRTFHNTIAIIDEVQNMSKASLQKVLTRFGKNCKIILIGSNNQIDHPHLNKYTNGLSVLLDACSHEHEEVNLHAVSLEKVVRGNIAEFSEKLFSAVNE